MIQYGQTSSEVYDIQLALLHMGYDLPKYGADKNCGAETWAAIEDCGRDNGFAGMDADDGLDESEPIPQALVDHIVGKAGEPGLEEAGPEAVEFFDVTKLHDGKHIKGRRSWKDVNGIMLHQTGIMMSNTPERFYRLRAHIGILALPEPTVVLANPLLAYMYHGNSLNGPTVGIEINGAFNGIEGKGKRPDVITDSQIEGTRRAMEWIVNVAAERGGEIKHVYPHRVSNGNKPSDPGEKVWRECGIWAQEHLDLSDGGPGFKSGKGIPIPGEWDDREAYQQYGYRA